MIVKHFRGSKITGVGQSEWCEQGDFQNENRLLTVARKYFPKVHAEERYDASANLAY